MAPKTPPSGHRPATPRESHGPVLDWLPPPRIGPRLPRVRPQSRRIRIPGWLAGVTAVVAVGVLAVSLRDALTDDTTSADRVRLGAQLGGELARREVLRFRAREGRWPDDLSSVRLDGMGLEYRVIGDRFEITGSDGADGRVRYEGSVDDLPPTAGPGDKTLPPPEKG